MQKPGLAAFDNHWPLDDGAPDNKVHGANMGPIGGRQDPGGPHVGYVIWAVSFHPAAPDCAKPGDKQGPFC